ncbi:MAG: 5-bromo-4-chloroindolyl phosphate hydrolysis protein [Herbinix sp.]|jgi:5-bromo-4-chloroindolyl phosphate hydrolysis protein|nr:5-bromo-4-chloroindolyl phosphate hydrolysis protein [Herbinix sp.]
MNKRGNLNLGDEIKNIVQDAVHNRDFNRLNRDIGNMVNGALDEVRNSLGWNRGNNEFWKVNDYQDTKEGTSQSSTQDQKQQDYTYTNNKDSYSNSNNSYSNSNNSYTRSNHSDNNYSKSNNNNNNYSNNNKNNYSYSYKNENQNNNRTYKQEYGQSKPIPKPVKSTVPVGHVSGILFTVFGTLGSTVSVIAFSVFAILGYLAGNSVLFYPFAVGFLVSFIACLFLSMKGSRIRKRLKRFERYISQMHGRNYCLIKDLSLVTGLSNKATVKDLQRMITIGMFPEGHIDDKKTCFMLNGESYEQYLNLQENMRMKDLEEKRKEHAQHKEQAMQKEQAKYKDQTNQEKNQKDALDPKIRIAIEEGRQYVQKIRDANIAIPGEEISRKLDALEEVIGKIFDYVEIHPEKFPEIKKFTEYFLPTTLKLVDAYKEFDYQPVEGENISNAKQEIEKTMDTINLAFVNLLDGLFEDVAMDISTDISVLETMFAQEGLTEKNIKIDKNMGD